MALSTEILADSPLAYYKLDETSGTTAADSSGNAHPGTHSNSAITNQQSLQADRTGKSGLYASGFSLATTLDTLGTMGNNMATGTFEFLIQTTNTSLGSAFGVVNTGGGIIVNALVNSQNEANVSGSLELYLRDTAGTNQLKGYSAVAINDGDVHHVVWVVRTSSTLELWVDGVSKTVTYAVQQAVAGAAFGFNMTLGARNLRGVLDRYLNANLDEVAFYTSRLSSARIGVHATAAGKVRAVGKAIATTGAGTLVPAFKAPVSTGTATAAGTTVTPQVTGSATVVVDTGTATAAGTTVTPVAASVVTAVVGQGAAIADGTTVTPSLVSNATVVVGRALATAAGSTVSPSSSGGLVIIEMTAAAATAAGTPTFGVVDDAETRLAMPPSFESGFGQAAGLYDQVGVNTHWIYYGTPYEDYNQTIADLAALGVRHIREGIIASWFDARSGASTLAMNALHARNQALPDSEQPIFVNGGTTEFPPQQNHVFTIADWFATMDAGHQHYNNDTNSGIPGAIPGVGGPLSNAAYPFATPEVPWALFSSIQSSNEPQGDVSQIPSWQHQLRLGKLQRSQAVLEGLPYVTPAGIQDGPAPVSALPVIGSVAMTNSTWDTWGDLSQGTGNVDLGDFHIYMGGSNPSFEHMANEMFNDRSYNGRLKLPLESHYPAAALPYVMTETGYITSGNDSAHFPIPADVVGKYILMTLLINAKLGFRRTFIYELYDEADLPTVSERNFGLIRVDGTPKASYYALRNYLTLTGFSEAPPDQQQELAYTITGFTPDPAGNFQVRTSDGSHYDTSADRVDSLCVQQDAFRYTIWVWRQINLYDREAGEYTTPDTQTLTLDLGDLDVASVSIATPSAGGDTTPDDGLSQQPLGIAGGLVDFPITGEPVAIAITVRPPAQDGGVSSFTLNRSDVFPVGTTVGLYTQLNPATQTPLSPSQGSATVLSDGTVTFTGLADGVTYYAYALVAGQPTHVSFQTTSTTTGGGGGGGIDVEADPLSVKLVPIGAQAIVPNADVPALTIKSYSGAASNASLFEARDAAASDALRAQITKEGTLKTYRTNAFFPNVQAFGAPTDTQPAAQLNGNTLSLGVGGTTAPDLTVTRTTNAAGAPRLSAAGITVTRNPMIDVTEYGAVGNNSTDNTTAVNAAIAAANPTNDAFAICPPLYFPTGTFRFSTACTLRGGIDIVSDGRTKLVASGNNYIFAHNAQGLRNRFRNLVFEALTTQTGGGAVDLRLGFLGTHFERCIFSNNLHTFVDARCGSRSDLWVVDCAAHSSTNLGAGASGNSFGFRLGDGTAQTNQMYFSNFSGTAAIGSTMTWIDVQYGDTLQLLNCLFNRGAKGIRAYGSGNNTGFKFTNTVFDSQITEAVAAEVGRDWDFTNCNIQGFGNNAGTPPTIPAMRWYSGTDYIRWHGGAIQGTTASTGLQIDSGGLGGHQVSGARIGDLDTLTGHSVSGILVKAGASYFRITDNHFRQGMVDGVKIETGASDHYVVTGNVKGTGVSGSICSDGGTGTNKIVNNVS